MDPWGRSPVDKYRDGTAGMPPERWATTVIPVAPVSAPTPTLSQERKGHGSSLALAALELAEKEKELIASLPRSGDGAGPSVGSRLLKMASVERDFDAGVGEGHGIALPGESTGTPGYERGEYSRRAKEVENGRGLDDLGRSGLKLEGGSNGCLRASGSSGGNAGDESGAVNALNTSNTFDQVETMNTVRPAHTTKDMVDDKNGRVAIDNDMASETHDALKNDICAMSGSTTAIEHRQESNLDPVDLSSRPSTSVLSKSPTYKMRQIQGFVQDRRMSSSPLASNDVDVAVRQGFGSDEASSSEANCTSAEVVFQRHFAGHPTMIFVGVLEGHGKDGRDMAVDMGRFLPETLEKEMTGLGLQRCSEDVIKLALVHACEAGHARLLQGGYATGSGITATFGLVAHDKAYVANVGKGRCVLVSERMLGQSVEFERISSDLDAVPSTPSELERILKCGGVVGRFEDAQGIPYGSLRIFREGSRTSPGVTSSRALGNAEGLECGVLPEPVVTECTLNSRNTFFIWGSEGLWDAIGDEDASRVVSQYAKRRVPGLTSADVLSFYAQSVSKTKKVGTQEAVNTVAVVVVDLREHIVPSEIQRLSDEEVAGLRAPRSNEEAYVHVRGINSPNADAAMDAMDAAFARVENLCELHKTKEIEFRDRTSSLTQMMRGESGEIGCNATPPQATADSGAGAGGTDRTSRAGQSLPVRHGGLPLMPSSSFEGIPLGGAVRQNAGDETSRGLSSAFVPSQAIGVPLTGVGRKHKVPVVSKGRPCIEDELRPIRKVGIPGVRSLSHIKSSDSPDESGLFSQQSQSLGMHEVWSLSEQAFSPQSSDGIAQTNSLLLDHGVGLRHEGKVRRGVPASFKSMSQLRLSSDSESDNRSWSRANSLEEEMTLGFEAPNSPMRHLTRVPSGSFGSGRGTSLLASSSYRNLRRQWSASVSNLQSLAEDGDGKQLQRKTSNSVHVVKDIHKFFN